MTQAHTITINTQNLMCSYMSNTKTILLQYNDNTTVKEYLHGYSKNVQQCIVPTSPNILQSLPSHQCIVNWSMLCGPKIPLAPMWS